MNRYGAKTKKWKARGCERLMAAENGAAATGQSECGYSNPQLSSLNGRHLNLRPLRQRQSQHRRHSSQNVGRKCLYMSIASHDKLIGSATAHIKHLQVRALTSSDPIATANFRAAPSSAAMLSCFAPSSRLPSPFKCTLSMQ